MKKVRPWCGQPSDQGRLKNTTEQVSTKLKVYRWSAGMASTVFSVPRVETRFELSEQSHWTWSAQSGCRFSTTAMKPAQLRVR